LLGTAWPFDLAPVPPPVALIAPPPPLLLVAGR
jgi:hypothetical protein